DPESNILVRVYQRITESAEGRTRGAGGGLGRRNPSGGTRLWMPKILLMVSGEADCCFKSLLGSANLPPKAFRTRLSCACKMKAISFVVNRGATNSFAFNANKCPMLLATAFRVLLAI